ncbi:MAG: response regulator [Bacteroidia bacterium]|nr:response regulator [Bacteroidia bacterium]
MKDSTFLSPLIFYAEDSAVQTQLFSCAMQEAKPRFEVVYFLNGELLIEGLSQAEREQRPFPNLILLDLEMPILNGFETLELLRKEKVFDEIRIFIFSSVVDDWMGKELIQMGANAYMRKPIDLDELISIIVYLDETI